MDERTKELVEGIVETQLDGMEAGVRVIFGVAGQYEAEGMSRDDAELRALREMRDMLARRVRRG